MVLLDLPIIESNHVYGAIPKRKRTTKNLRIYWKKMHNTSNLYKIYKHYWIWMKKILNIWKVHHYWLKKMIYENKVWVNGKKIMHVYNTEYKHMWISTIESLECWIQTHAHFATVIGLHGILIPPMYKKILNY